MEENINILRFNTQETEEMPIEVEPRKDVIIVGEGDDAEEIRLRIKLSRVYNFEGKNISEIDLTGLNDLTANDMIKAKRQMEMSGSVTVFTEADMEYLFIIASYAAKLPIEFFKGLRMNDAMKVRNRVQAFFGSDE